MFLKLITRFSFATRLQSCGKTLAMTDGKRQSRSCNARLHKQFYGHAIGHFCCSRLSLWSSTFACSQRYCWEPSISSLALSRSYSRTIMDLSFGKLASVSPAFWLGSWQQLSVISFPPQPVHDLLNPTTGYGPAVA